MEREAIPVPHDLAIRGGRIHTATSSYSADVYIDHGRIERIAPPGERWPSKREIDARGLDILPGIWHCHCHFRDPGYTDKEDFATGTKAAALGGVTFCIDQPNTKPIPVTVEAFEDKKSTVSPKAYVDYGLNAGGLIPEEISGLAAAGAISIKIFNTRHVRDSYPYIPALSVVEHDLMYQLFEASADSDILVSVHPDDADWSRARIQAEYIDRGLTTRAHYEEAYERGLIYGHGMVVGLAAAAYYAELAHTRLYGLHLGLMPTEGLKVARDAKVGRKTPFYAELELSAMTQTRDQAARMGPRTMTTGRHPRAEYWRAVADGTVDTLVLEHAPHTLGELEPGWNDHFSIPLGATGAQEMVPMLLTAVNAGNMTLQDVVRLCSENPAKIFGVFPRKGQIAVGADADLTIVDMDRVGRWRDEDMASKVSFTSWNGMQYTGSPTHTIVRGAVVMESGRILGNPGYGEFTGPTRSEAGS